MSELRLTGSPCPIDERPVSMSLCETCRYMRGGSLTGREGWKITCNWPRDGSDIWVRPIPPMISEAFRDDVEG